MISIALAALFGFFAGIGITLLVVGKTLDETDTKRNDFHD